MKPQTMRRLRQWHQYLGMFFAPAILFFSFSGALQELGLHESHDPAVKPAGWIVWMSDVHKESRVMDHSRRRGPPPGPPAAANPGANAQAAREHEHEEDFLPFKPFAVLLAIMLIGTTILGITIALNNRAARRNSLIALAAGVVVPLVLILA